MVPGKVRGADGWGPRDLALLPDRWLDASGRMMGIGIQREHGRMAGGAAAGGMLDDTKA